MSDGDFASDDAADRPQPVEANVLKVYQAGEVTVVGFDGKDVPDEVCIAAYRDHLFRLIDEQHCRLLAFDLTGVSLIPSGMLGLLLSLKKRGVEVELYNPSDDVREVLDVTHLGGQFVIRNVEM